MRFMSEKEKEIISEFRPTEARSITPWRVNDFSQRIPLCWVQDIWRYLDHCEMPEEFKELRIAFYLNQYLRMGGAPQLVGALRELLAAEGPGYTGCWSCDRVWKPSRREKHQRRRLPNIVGYTQGYRKRESALQDNLLTIMGVVESKNEQWERLYGHQMRYQELLDCILPLGGE